MSPLISARRVPGAVLVTGIPGLPNWSATVHDDGALTIHPAPGERLSQPAIRRIPFGTVIGAAEQITRDVRVRELVQRGAPNLSPADRVPGAQRHRVVARWYREALAAGLTPREVVAGVYGVPAATAAKWIAEARAEGVIESMQIERRTR